MSIYWANKSSYFTTSSRRYKGYCYMFWPFITSRFLTLMYVILKQL